MEGPWFFITYIRRALFLGISRFAKVIVKFYTTRIMLRISASLRTSARSSLKEVRRQRYRTEQTPKFTFVAIGYLGPYSLATEYNSTAITRMGKFHFTIQCLLYTPSTYLDYLSSGEFRCLRYHLKHQRWCDYLLLISTFDTTEFNDWNYIIKY